MRRVLQSFGFWVVLLTGLWVVALGWAGAAYISDPRPAVRHPTTVYLAWTAFWFWV